MTRTSLDHHNCSLARTVDVVGDRWTLMILRDAFYGIRRFTDFKKRLGITQAVLSARLSHLVDHEIVTKTPVGETASRDEYRLTPKGRDLFPAIVALVQWGDQHLHGDIGPPIELRDRRSQLELDQVSVTSSGKVVDPGQVQFLPGPGATPETVKIFEELGAK